MDFIGAATAAALAAQGAAMALAARRRDKLESLAASIRDQGGTALMLESDITEEKQATDAVARTVAELTADTAFSRVLGEGIAAAPWRPLSDYYVHAISSLAA